MIDPASERIDGSSVSPQTRRRGLETARAVEIRAQSSRWADSPPSRAALARLDVLLAGRQPPKRDVPPGYYLDIVV